MAKAYRASILHSIADPAQVGIEASYEYFKDGILLVKDGHIKAVGHARDILPKLDIDATPIEDHRGRLVTPAFIDTHIHFPQIDVVASYGEQLLDWLQTYVFPAESRFADGSYAARVARRFIVELLRNGTTTALVFCTSHAASVDAFFTAAEELGLRMVAGKVLMDRNAPAALTDTPESAYAESAQLIRRWHGRGRLRYAVTPRFAITSTSDQLAVAGRLLKEHPDVYLHTHLSESAEEIDAVRKLFPDYNDYLQVYEGHGLVGPRSVFAHCVHLTDDERRRLAKKGSAVALCPTSNLFLGSGLFDLEGLEGSGVRVGMGTDIGGGTSFSMLRTMGEAYKVCQLRRQKLHPMKAFYLATLGGARVLSLDSFVGSLKEGKEADFVLFDLQATELLEYRVGGCSRIEEEMFVLMVLGDDRCVFRTISGGKVVYSRPGR